MTEISVCGIIKIKIHSMKADQERKAASVLWHIRTTKTIYKQQESDGGKMKTIDTDFPICMGKRTGSNF